MFENLKNGWKLGSATRKLIFGDKGLLVYPIVGGIITFLLALVLFVPLVLTIATASNTLILAAVILFGFVSTFVSIYFLVALLLAFRQYSRTGKKMAMGDALAQASQYWVQILEWAVFYTIIVTLSDQSYCLLWKEQQISLPKREPSTLSRRSRTRQCLVFWILLPLV